MVTLDEAPLHITIRQTRTKKKNQGSYDGFRSREGGDDPCTLNGNLGFLDERAMVPDRRQEDREGGHQIIVSLIKTAGSARFHLRSLTWFWVPLRKTED